jgi:ribonuclease E
VNSGRATREHSIEETATKTNLEAADEIARQLRLRDLAGLIVIDFIDMEDSLNDRADEKRMHNALRNDRARIQIGKISQFGLLEMSRQRLRAGVIAGSTIPCPHCDGQGIVRSVESTALRLLRSLEEEGQKQRASAVTVKAPGDVAIYTLNQKRRELARIESEYGMTVMFDPSDEIHAGHFDIDRTAQKAPEDRKVITVSDMPQPPEVEEDPEIAEEETGGEDASEDGAEHSAQNEQPQDAAPRRGRRRRRRGGRDRERPATIQEPVSPQSVEMAAIPTDESQEIENPGEPHQDDQPHVDDQQQGEAGRKRRRRRRRGGRGRNREHGAQQDGAQASGESEPNDEGAPPHDETATPNTESAPMWSLDNGKPAAEIKSEPVIEQPMSVPEPATASAPAPEPEKPASPPRRGWWQRTFSPD